MPLQATSGAASYDAFGGGVAVVPTYIEDVFSSYLLLGNATTTTVNNGIDLSTKGGLVWLKDRTGGGYHSLADTARSGKRLFSNDSLAEVSSYPFAFTSTGFTADGNLLDSGRNFVSWTFRKQPKFFDVVTYTGTGVARTVAHNLGSVPGCIIVKRTDTAGFDWLVYHRSTGNTNRLLLNDTVPAASGTSFWNDTTPTSTVFTVGTNVNGNASGGTYVAYLFAHDAGGFGLTGTDNVISCGSFTTDGSGNATVSLGYEPQWALWKTASGTYPVDGWHLSDNMRGWSQRTNQDLTANTSSAESAQGASWIVPNATGFSTNNTGALAPTTTYIYIAIRRGPMKVPTDATKVFKPVAATPSGSQDTVTTGFPTDFIITTERSHSLTGQTFAFDRLRGGTTTQRVYLTTNNTNAETSAGGGSFGLDSNVAVYDNFYQYSGITNPVIYWNFKRAPSFFDEVCYTGTGVARTVSHNLAAVPQLMITKVRSSAGYGWFVYPLDPTKYMELNSTSGTGVTSSAWNDTAPTASVFTVGAADQTNLSGATMVAYLFATCAGVSKVGSYTGTAATLQIDCGFTGGARFVLIKRTDSTGAWYVWDTARGIVSGNDSYLLLNSTAAEVTNTDYIDTYSAGFEISSTAPAAINANGGTFIFLAIA